MSEKVKIKNKKKLPTHIQYSVIIWYFISGVVMPALLLIPSAMGIEIPKKLDNVRPDYPCSDNWLYHRLVDEISLCPQTG